MDHGKSKYFSYIFLKLFIKIIVIFLIDFLGWLKEENGSDSIAVQLADEKHWDDLVIIIAVVRLRISHDTLWSSYLLQLYWINITRK